MSEQQPDPPRLSPLPARLAVYGVLVVVAVGSIWLIDARAMERQQAFRDEMPPSEMRLIYDAARAALAEREPELADRVRPRWPPIERDENRWRVRFEPLRDDGPRAFVDVEPVTHQVLRIRSR